ncbi:LytTR family DNA-binding domain-containing protein [Aestuariibius sp. HNIBRBA575]|uniref:LytTR family DNA-binding domain-containing protein n=1 Tax=Aestuariibius sp. HNIBRBA575 TaxID=3233343 RepID=UPI0034A41E43
MSPSPMETARQQVLTWVKNPTIWIALMSAGVIFGIAGPFETHDKLSLLGRLIYWPVMVTLTFFTGAIGSIFAAEPIRAKKKFPYWVSVAAGSVAAALLVLPEVALVNWLVFGLDLADMKTMVMLWLEVLAVAICVTFTFAMIKLRIAKLTTDPVSATSRLLDRLPADKRGDLISLSATDHYVDVVTNKGGELLLIRLTDAIQEVPPTKGLRVHRSHWVALNQVTDAQQTNGKTVLRLSDGRDIPVSRTYLPAVKEAGLLSGVEHG